MSDRLFQMAFLSIISLACASAFGQEQSESQDTTEPTRDLAPATSLVVKSPGDALAVRVGVRDGQPLYRIERFGVPVIDWSRLGFTLADDVSLASELIIVRERRNESDSTWTQVWGEQREIRDHHRDLAIDFAKSNADDVVLTVVFRVFDDGAGFRYKIPQSPLVDDIVIMEELTEFAIVGDPRAWWIPGMAWNRYEYTYNDTPTSEVELAHTPITFETKDSLCFSIHEAALTDFASITLERTAGSTLKAKLVPWSDGVLVRGTAPMQSPWRTIQIADTAGGLVENYLILNLNEPNKIADTSWIKPAKYCGIWWEMHLDIATWGSGEKHGATTANTKRYIDFAAANCLDGVLVEGWNTGWDGDWTANGGKFSFTEPYPDYDLEALARYAKEKGVYLIGHHETSAGIANYERQLEDAFAQLARLGIPAVKTGYVSHGQNITRIDADGNEQKEWHHGQFMVRHYRKVIETAARHRVMLNVHEPIKDTGIRRTWPNMLTREGAKGQEFNAWGGDGANPPDHETVLVFTRMLAGPMDFTPGIFDLLFPEARPTNRVRTTLAKQLALYVVLYSPLQMAADLPQNYEAKPAPYRFICDVPVDWDETVVLNGRIGDYVTIARKDRNSEDWYLGAITDEHGRNLTVDLSFLTPGITYTAEIYRDSADANWDTNPYPIEIEKREVNSTMKLPLRLAPGGGCAVRIRKQSGITIVTRTTKDRHLVPMRGGFFVTESFTDIRVNRTEPIEQPKKLDAFDRLVISARDDRKKEDLIRLWRQTFNSELWYFPGRNKKPLDLPYTGRLNGEAVLVVFTSRERAFDFAKARDLERENGDYAVLEASPQDAIYLAESFAEFGVKTIHFNIGPNGYYMPIEDLQKVKDRLGGEVDSTDRSK